MRSCGWALIQHDWCVYKSRTQTHAEGRPCEDAERRLPSVPLMPLRVSSVTHVRALPWDSLRWDPRVSSCISALTGVAVGHLHLYLSARPCREVIRAWKLDVTASPSSGRCLRVASTV